MIFFSKEEERKENDERIKRLENLTKKRNALEQKIGKIETVIFLSEKMEMPRSIELEELLKDCRLQKEKIEEKIRSI